MSPLNDVRSEPMASADTMTGAPVPQDVDSELFRNLIGHFATGVTVITASEDGTRFGSTASAVSSLSLEPPMLLVCLNHSSATGQAIERVGHFAVNILSDEIGRAS